RRTSVGISLSPNNLHRSREDAGQGESAMNTRFGMAVLAAVAAGVIALAGRAAPAGAEVRLDSNRASADKLLVVDCLLPSQVRQLGARMTYLSPRRPIKTSIGDCELKGGEYVAYDRGSLGAALALWLPQAERGDKEAQTYIGELYERGLGATPPDYAAAAGWYRKAA